MLAASIRTEKGESLEQLIFPLLATPKIDGIRCLVIDGVAMSRSLKPIPNRFIQSMLGHREFDGLDGELIVGNTFQDATSGIMSEDGQPDFRFTVFDLWNRPELTYADRCKALVNSNDLSHDRIQILDPVECRDVLELGDYTEQFLAAGYEGAMVRRAFSPYKHGRATFREGYLTKVKPFVDDEAVVVGFEEQMHNANEAKTNALGRTERSSHKGNLVGKDTLGALIVEHPKFGRFNIGTGFTDAVRVGVWLSRPGLLGRVVKFKYQAIGTKDKPRIPVYLGWRDPRDT
ncbi:ATP dependent DNA ligase-like protein [Opitutaceae bacterium TAV1]|nr:ATP dependent DNA ligase-like protein [Opitutaceae bacterium TAV1]